MFWSGNTALSRARLWPSFQHIRLAFLGFGFIGPAEQSQRTRQIAVSAAAARIKAQGLVQVRDGFLELSLSGQSRAEIIMRIGIVRIEAQYCLIMADGLL